MTAETEGSFRRLERELGFLLRRARTLQARTAAQLHPDLEPAALGLLALLQDEGPLRASDLVIRLGLDKSTVSRQVTSLVELGLVDRAPDPEDGRAQVLQRRAPGPPAHRAGRLAGRGHRSPGRTAGALQPRDEPRGRRGPQRRRRTGDHRRLNVGRATERGHAGRNTC